MRKYFSLSLVVMAIAAAQLFAIGEARITGKVVDTQGKPVPEAKITVAATEQITFKQTFTADKKGNFAIFLLNGTIKYDFLVEKEGYQGVQEVMKLKLVPEKNEKTFTLGLPSSAAAAVEAKPDPAIVAYNEGVELLNAEKYEEALAKFKESVQLNPEFATGYKTLVITYAHTKDWKSAIEASAKAVELNPDDEDIAAALAAAYEQTGDKVKAAEFRKKAPANPNILFNEAARLINAGKDTEAEPILKQAIAATEAELGAVSLSDTEGNQTTVKATAPNAKFAFMYYELGTLYARLGKNADARTYLKKYILLDPNGKDVQTAKEMLKYVQ